MHILIVSLGLLLGLLSSLVHDVVSQLSFDPDSCSLLHFLLFVQVVHHRRKLLHSWPVYVVRDFGRHYFRAEELFVG